MAKCHLYLMALGFDVDDIVAFMTSEAVSFIDKISENNVFVGYNQDINYLIEAAINYLINPSNDLKLERTPSILAENIQLKLNSILRSKNS